jgi:diguanylate cyclase (GGDEF)-like protein
LRSAELKQKVVEVEYLSLTDPLTDIANRRKMQLCLNEEIKRMERTGLPFSIILMDLDFFKKINDTYGHEVGDKVLKEFSKTISAHIRALDIFGRMGGEEFLLICPNTSEAGVLNLAEKLRKEVEKIPLPDGTNLTASFGCATRAKGESESSLLSRADQAMYRAKELGRNRVEIIR